MIKTYYMLTKPGIIMGNAITTAAGFALASNGSFDYLLFLVTLLGLSLVVASAGVFNNYIDRAMDAKMERTKNRPLVTGKLSSVKALLFACLLGMIGFTLLGIYTNTLTVCVTFVGFFTYLTLYAFYKYRSFYGTLVGSIAGAIPPVVGYCAASNQLDVGAFLIFMILVLWQMPHFFAIAIYRFKDYEAASIPVLPIVKGMQVTKIHMIYYIMAFIITASLLTFTGYTGYLYLIVTVILGLIWLQIGVDGFFNIHNTAWAKKMFVFSLVVIMALCLSIVIDRV